MEHTIIKILPAFYREVYEDSKVKPRTKVVMVASAYVILISFVATVFFASRGLYYYRHVEQSYQGATAAISEEANYSIDHTNVGEVSAGSVGADRRISERVSPVAAKAGNILRLVKNEHMAVAIDKTDAAGMHVNMVLQRNVGASQIDSIRAALGGSSKGIFVVSAEADADKMSSQEQVVDSLLRGGLKKMMGEQGVADSNYREARPANK